MIDSPTAVLIKNLRLLIGWTQAEAADTVYVSTRAWQLWEAGARRMPPAAWELVCIKAGMHPEYKHAKSTSDRPLT